MKSLYQDILNLMNKIESSWQKTGFKIDNFSSIVWEKTDKFDFSPLGDVSNQLKLLELSEVRHQQHLSTFSDMHFQIYHNGRFLIEILNWSGSHVNAHDHDFSAVQFQLKGDSLNVLYDFKPQEDLGSLHFGNLKVREAILWKEGGRSVVRPGCLDPHAVFHIGQPTTSLMIRTIATPYLGAQKNYFPTLAANYYVSNAIQRKKLTGLRLMSDSSASEFRRMLLGYLNSQSLAENFFMLVKLSPVLFQKNFADILVTYAAQGVREAKLVESVALDFGSNFFSTLITENPNLSFKNKVVGYAFAASMGRDNYVKLIESLNGNLESKISEEQIQSLLENLNSSKRHEAARWLEVFNISEVRNEAV